MSSDEIINPLPPPPPPDQAPLPIVLPVHPHTARAVAPPSAIHPPQVVRVRQNYSIGEKLSFLRIIEDVLPIGQAE